MNGTGKRGENPGYLYFCADALTLFYEGIVYFSAFVGPVYAFVRLRHRPVWLLTMTGLGAWLVAALVFALILILTKRVLIGSVPYGRYFLTGTRLGRWLAADRVMKIMFRSPFRWLVTENAFFRRLFYRGMGADIDPTLLLGNGAKLPEPWAVSIGRNVLIGDDAVVSGHKVEHNVVTLGRVEIGDNVLIGARSVIFPDVEIGNGAVVGASSVVTRGTRVGPGETWSGNPARKVEGFGLS